ncbi:unnamed protein product [Effrenium voratum]|nr:unnamed protein product [Effrenium voratum]
MWCRRFASILQRPGLGPGAPLLARQPDISASQLACRWSGSYSRIMKRNRPPYIDFETGFPKEELPKQSVIAAFTLAKQQKLEKLLEATPQKTFRGRVIKGLSTGRKRHSGRNDVGRITTRHREGGCKQRLRFVDFKRARRDIPATVLRIEYAPDRSSHIALVQYEDGVLSYILAPLTLRPGDQVLSSETANIVPGNSLPLRHIPVGSIIHNIELRPGAGSLSVLLEPLRPSSRRIPGSQPSSCAPQRSGSSPWNAGLPLASSLTWSAPCASKERPG